MAAMTRLRMLHWLRATLTISGREYGDDALIQQLRVKMLPWEDYVQRCKEI